MTVLPMGTELFYTDRRTGDKTNSLIFAILRTRVKTKILRRRYSEM